MKKNLYYRQVFRRTSAVTEFFVGFFLAIASWPRLLLEVYLRKNFGERYFSFSQAILILILLALYPIIYVKVFLYFRPLHNEYYFDENPFGIWAILKANWLWYAFVAPYLYVIIKRKQEISRSPSVFDLGRFSLSAGEIHPWFLALRFGTTPVSIRTIETLLEPGLCFLIGLLIWLRLPHVGYLVMGCSVIYSLSYVAAYYQGDNFLMDQIDEMICNEELASAFVDNLDSSQTRGVHFYGRRPADPETRRQVAETFTEQTDDVVEAR